MPIAFTKMHGLGNDYVYVSLFDQQVPAPETLAPLISHRQRGVGSDGLILVAPPTDDTCDVRMIMYNSDGSRAQMCGNGIRCVAKLAYERGLARRNSLRIGTDAGVLEVELQLDAHDRVVEARVDMGEPILEPRRIPVAVDAKHVIDRPFVIEGTTLPMTCVSMGNPHAVFFVSDVAAVPLARWGPQIEHDPLFPERINVHFAQVLTSARVRARTWERGAGMTLACGTGASAVCVAGAVSRRTQRHLVAELPGGELELAWHERTNRLWMTGPAVEVFTGVWP